MLFSFSLKFIATYKETFIPCIRQVYMGAVIGVIIPYVNRKKYYY